MESTQLAVQVTKHDTLDVAGSVTTARIPRLSPGPGEVLVQVKLRPIHPADVLSIIGVYPGWKPKGLPAVPGQEGMGVVVESGEGATRFAPGQRVVGTPWPSIKVSASGTWQQFMVASESSLLPVPDSVSDEAAAQFWVNPVSAYGVLDELAMPEGEWLLQTAAGSVLGRQLIQLAKHRGIRTINVVRRRQQEGELKALGADEILVSSEGDWVEKVKSITGGRGAYAAVDAVAGDTLGKVMSATRSNGQVILYGALSGGSLKASIVDPLYRNVTLKGFWLTSWAASLSPERRAEVFPEIMSLIERGAITPYTGKRFPLEAAANAVAHAIALARGGKVLLEG